MGYKLKKIISVVGARPNFMKVAPIHRAFQEHKDSFIHLICHTGQHFDTKMSDVFFKELGIPFPTFNLGIGAGSHAEQTGKIIIEMEKILLAEKPDLLMVYGDVNSTMAASIAASKLGIRIAHVEAGLRSFDRKMPEELNRLVTDVLADYLFVTEEKAVENLEREGLNPEKVFFVGNVMIDTLMNSLPLVAKSTVLEGLNLINQKYVLVTFHRPSNVDSFDDLKSLVEFLDGISSQINVVFPIHPRTKFNLEKYCLLEKLNSSILVIDPLGYIDFMSLVKNASLIITDSGGIQEESTFLGVQCITVRNNTERPVTVDIGTNQLVGTDLTSVSVVVSEVLKGREKLGAIPDLWDGNSAKRIVGKISEILNH